MKRELRRILSSTLGFVQRARSLAAKATRAVVAFLGLGLGSQAAGCEAERAEQVDVPQLADNALVHQSDAESQRNLLEALELFSPSGEGPLGLPSSFPWSLKGDGEGRRETLRQLALAQPVGGFIGAPRYACDDFEVQLDRRGRPRYRRLRKPWTKADKERFRGLVEMVAEEMDADPRLIRLWALRESTYNPNAIHILNPDLRGADRSYERHHWTAAKEDALRKKMARTSVKSKAYWEAKADLKRLFRFKDNPFFEAEVEYDIVYDDGSRARERASRWSYGYGPFGFNPTYFLPLWDVKAPPWVFCNADGIPAIVTAIWSARKGQRECRAQGYGDSYEAVNRRFSSGRCAPRPARAHLFRKRARAWGIDPRRSAKLGKAWPEAETDRYEIVEHMRALAQERGLLSQAAR